MLILPYNIDMRDIGKFINLGFTISGIIVFCLYLGYKFNNFILWIVVGVISSLAYLFTYLLRK